MVDAALAAEFPWLRTDPTPILGDARPRTTAELLAKPPVWHRLYREWMANAHPDQLAIFDRITRSETGLVEDAARLEPYYAAFYEAAGKLKDAARSDPAGVRQLFPWAPDDPKALLGVARPKDVAALVAEGTSSPWAKVFDVWLTANQPFEDADKLFRRVMTGTRGDQARLDPSVAGFAHVMGKIKDRLREKHGNKAQRVMRQVGETAERLNTAGQRGGLINDLTRGTAGGGAASTAQQPAKAAAKATATAPAAKAAATTPKQGTAAAPAKAHPAAAPARPKVSPALAAVQQQLQMALPIAEQTPSLIGWVDYLAQRFTAFGGTLAEEAANLHGYKALLEADGGYLGEQLSALAGQGGGTDDALYGALAMLRNAVYRVAWNIDLSYQNYYGGWPHQRISYIVAELNSSGSPRLCYDGARALYHLLGSLDSVYDTAMLILDAALRVVVTRPPGYNYEDGAEVWSTHEMMRAKAELSGLTPIVAAWCAQAPNEEEHEDESSLDQASYQVFGMPYQTLLQLAGG
jgi:hypothetical protein